MKRSILVGVLACSGILAVAPLARGDGPQAGVVSGKPVNAMCPVGKEPIVPSAGTVEYNGHTIGLCCPACGKAFLGWEESRRDEFVAMAMLGEEPGQEVHGDAEKATSKPAATPPAVTSSFAYTLDTCVVSGQKLGSMGDPIIKTYDDREVRFCCGGCISRFEADQRGYFKKIDELIIKDQLRYYPTDKCIVTGEPLMEDGKDIAVNVVYQDRLIRLCCKMCVRKVQADPKKFIAMLDQAAVEAQKKDYPIETCVVAGGALGSMGEPSLMVLGGRLLQFCCAGCEPRAEADPVKYLAIIDKAWQAKGKYIPAPEEDPDDHAGHDHGPGGHGG